MQLIAEKGLPGPVKTDFFVNDLYTACSICEDFEGRNPSNEETLKAWAYIAKTKAYLRLQGWYGRTLESIIEEGLISISGEITKKGKSKF